MTKAERAALEAELDERNASETRRGIGIPTPDSDADGAASSSGSPPAERHAERVRAARVRAVGTGFLRWRPFIVAPVALGQGLALARADVPAAQRVGLALAMAATLALFIAEALVVRRRVVTERWLFASLAITAAAIALGLVMSGGLASPLLVLVLAPVVVAFAAFGRRAATLRLLVGAVAAVVAIGAAGQLGQLPWGAVPEPMVGWMRLIAFAGTAALAWSGVARLADAYADAGAELEALRRAAIEEGASRLREREQVSAKVAHELKNPLAAIKALVQLERGRLTEGDRSALRLGVVLGEIDRMEALVRDYLGFSRPIAALRREPLEALGLVRDIVSLLAAKAEAAGVDLRVSGEAGSLMADRARLREVLFNLADNALHATPAGGSVEIAYARDGATHRLRIADRGPGLDPIIAAAFESGQSAYLTTRPGGSGLGLAIAKAAVEQHGGRLRFSPREGGGTVALIELPLEGA